MSTNNERTASGPEVPGSPVLGLGDGKILNVMLTGSASVLGRAVHLLLQGYCGVVEMHLGASPPMAALNLVVGPIVEGEEEHQQPGADAARGTGETGLTLCVPLRPPARGTGVPPAASWPGGRGGRCVVLPADEAAARGFLLLLRLLGDALYVHGAVHRTRPELLSRLERGRRFHLSWGQDPGGRGLRALYVAVGRASLQGIRPARSRVVLVIINGGTDLTPTEIGRLLDRLDTFSPVLASCFCYQTIDPLRRDLEVLLLLDTDGSEEAHNRYPDSMMHETISC